MNKYANLRIKDFTSDEELMEHMLEIAMDTNEIVALYATSDYASYVMTELITKYECEVGLIDLCCGIYDGEYGEEYIIEIDNDLNVCVSPAWRNDTLLRTDAVVNFVHQDFASQELIDGLLDRDENTVLFGVTDEDIKCNHDCENCHVHEDVKSEQEEKTVIKEEPKSDDGRKRVVVSFGYPDSAKELDIMLDRFEKTYNSLHEGLMKLFR